MGIDTNRRFVPLGIAILTISDTRDEASDSSGAFLAEAAAGDGHRIVSKEIIPDDQGQISDRLRSLCIREDVDAVICTGGTGLTGRDVTPEALEQVSEKWIPGFGELFRWLSYQKIGTSTIQSRACAATVEGKLVFALPGSTGACRDAWEGILGAQLDIRHRPCNFAEILPRMKERPEARRKG
jgi:molybdopterin adenylyltransferase